MKKTLYIVGGVLVLLAAIGLLSDTSSPSSALVSHTDKAAQQQTATPDYTSDELASAVKFGTENKLDNLAVAKKYRINYNFDYRDWIIVYTPWAQLAVTAQDAARSYKDLSQEKIDAFASNNTLSIAAVSYGSRIDFADDFKAVIKLGDQVIQPTDVENSRNVDTTAVWPEYPQYSATTSVLFDNFGRFKGKKFQFVLIKPNAEKSFEIDLTALQ